MKMVVSPSFASLRPLLERIVAGTYTPQHVYCHRRNVVERVVAADRQCVVVKRFRTPNALNRWVYGLLRKSKARRAYEYGMRLLQAGIATPQPIAYMEERRGCRFARSWLVSEQAEGTPFSELYACLRTQAAQGDGEAASTMQQLRTALTKYVIHLEQHCICPGDFNHANIIVEQREGRFHFQLVDINRMRFGRTPTLKSTMKMYSQFCRNYQDAVDFLSLYAESKGIDFDHCMYVFARQRHHLLRRKQRKQMAHKLLHDDRQ